MVRLRAVSLFLENPWERTQNKKTCKRDCERDLRAAMPRAASSVGVERRVKRETALVSYNDLDAQHSGDGVILLVGLRSYDAHLQSCPILSNRVHPTKQHSICCRSQNCISLERSGQSAVDSIDLFDLSNGKDHYRFDKCGRRSDK